MSAIKSKDTKPGGYLRKLMYHQCFRYRKNYSGVFIHPIIYLPRYKVAIFVHGCYWHWHSGCQYAYMPKSLGEFWQRKFESIARRDQLVRDTLENEGIRCLVVWECTIKKIQRSKDSEKTELSQPIYIIRRN